MLALVEEEEFVAWYRKEGIRMGPGMRRSKDSDGRYRKDQGVRRRDAVEQQRKRVE